MKKVTLLLSMLLCYLLGHSQTLYPTVSVIESGDILTINAAGETDASYFSGIFMPNQTGIIESSPDVFGSTYISIIPVGYITFYNIVSKTPTTFKIQFKNNHPINDYTIKLQFLTVTNGTTSVTANKTINIKIKHAPPVPLTYYNDALSKPFKKNNCALGLEGSDVPYIVPANKYSSSISKGEANNQALNEANTNGQNYANANGQCLTFYYNTEISGSFTKNNCGPEYTSSTVTYVVTANKHKSAISQSDVDQMAINDLNSNGQNNANNLGTCTEKRKKVRAWYRPNGCDKTGEISVDLWIGSTFKIALDYSFIPKEAYTTQTGMTSVPDGNYRFFVPIDPNQPGYPLFFVSGGMVSYYSLCP